MKRSQSILLLLSGALATTIGPAGCGQSPPPPPPPPAPPAEMLVEADQVQPDQDQANNSYVPGVGYYHSVSNAYYPYPFNWYDPVFGYYYNGGWQPTAYIGIVPMRSRPSTTVIVSIHNTTRYSSSVGSWTSISHANSVGGSSSGRSSVSTGGSVSGGSAGRTTVSTGGSVGSNNAGRSTLSTGGSVSSGSTGHTMTSKAGSVGGSSSSSAGHSTVSTGGFGSSSHAASASS